MVRLRTFIFLMLGFASVLFFLFVSLTSRFNLLGVPVMSLPFADLRLVSSASDCVQNEGWSYFDLNCDPWGRPFNYPSLWVKIFSTLGIVESQTEFIGRMQIILLIVAIFWWVKFTLQLTASKHNRSILIGVAVIFSISPPVLLLMERGNVDIWIFFGLSIASVLFSRGYYYVPIALLSFLGALKIYPFASVVMVFKSKFSLKRVFFFLITFGLAGISFLGEWQLVLNRSISTWNSISYGSSLVPLILFQVLGVAGSKSLATILGWSVFLITVLIMKFSFAGQLTNLGKTLSLNSNLLIVLQGFGSAFLFTYLVGTSYDLRLILLLPIFLSFACLTRNGRQNFSLIAILFVIMYGGQFTSGFGKVGLFLNFISDVSLSIFSSFLLLIIWQTSLPRLKRFNPIRRHR